MSVGIADQPHDLGLGAHRHIRFATPSRLVYVFPFLWRVYTILLPTLCKTRKFLHEAPEESIRELQHEQLLLSYLILLISKH